MNGMMPLELDEKWKFASMDLSGDWFFYTSIPEKSTTGAWWKLAGGEVLNPEGFLFPGGQTWGNSLHEIIHQDGRAYLRKYVDVPGDGEPVFARDSHCNCWSRRISAGKTINRRNSTSIELVCYKYGRDKFTSKGMTDSWKEWRRPTPEEMP